MFEYYTKYILILYFRIGNVDDSSGGDGVRYRFWSRFLRSVPQYVLAAAAATTVGWCCWATARRYLLPLCLLCWRPLDAVGRRSDGIGGIQALAYD